MAVGTGIRPREGCSPKAVSHGWFRLELTCASGVPKDRPGEDLSRAKDRKCAAVGGPTKSNFSERIKKVRRRIRRQGDLVGLGVNPARGRRTLSSRPVHLGGSKKWHRVSKTHAMLRMPDLLPGMYLARTPKPQSTRNLTEPGFAVEDFLRAGKWVTTLLKDPDARKYSKNPNLRLEPRQKIRRCGIEFGSN